MTGDDLAARDLWNAVLLQAVKDLCGTVVVDGPIGSPRYLDRHRERIRRQVLSWFIDPDPASAFACVCEACGVDPDAIRVRVLGGGHCFPPERKRAYSMAKVH